MLWASSKEYFFLKYFLYILHLDTHSYIFDFKEFKVKIDKMIQENRKCWKQTEIRLYTLFLQDSKKMISS